MKPIVFGGSVKGADHERRNLPCQDSYSIRDNTFKSAQDEEVNHFYSELSDDTVIVAVADGHGSSSCPYSEIGSSIAVDVFSDIMAEYCCKYREDISSFEYLLKRESDVIRLSQTIESEWKLRIWRHYFFKKGDRPILLTREKELERIPVYGLYGTTLLGCLITESFVFFLQLGDGDINCVEENEVRNLVKSDKLLGVETHSLSKEKAWTKVSTSFYPIEVFQNRPMMFMVSTDGLINSYATGKDFEKSCFDYLHLIGRYGSVRVEEMLPEWLTTTSRNGCGDDTTVVFVYYPNDEQSTSHLND